MGSRRCSRGSGPIPSSPASAAHSTRQRPHEELEHVATLIPDEWLAPSATGSPEQSAAKVQGQLDLGADGVILHGASPAELAPVLAAIGR